MSGTETSKNTMADRMLKRSENVENKLYSSLIQKIVNRAKDGFTQLFLYPIDGRTYDSEVIEQHPFKDQFMVIKEWDLEDIRIKLLENGFRLENDPSNKYIIIIWR